MIKTAIEGVALVVGVAQFFYIIILLIFYTIEKQECVDTGNYVLMDFRDFKTVYKACPWRFSVHQFSVKDRAEQTYIVFSFVDGLRVYGIFRREYRKKRRSNRMGVGKCTSKTYIGKL